MSKKRKKKNQREVVMIVARLPDKQPENKKSRIDWKTLIATSILDFIIGFILLLVGQYLVK